ncbi:hypothetical protein DACRYDRAFT_95562 [Dacryopinax primogenitus]|uniref:Uncharacterized protein n=1 Tax=Dacryopinax primogenitus (strain DJM 731) TaxID=1858805 RepID=M5FWZ8_DACPD|nr:uncharacterized protein DACRYDRAFT_95562 [Dacryopinax primogenitus]EJU00215.1 hypothetical protein DACRYDRAFT_95562 [Dacryopinax primogenitus]
MVRDDQATLDACAVLRACMSVASSGFGSNLYHLAAARLCGQHAYSYDACTIDRRPYVCTSHWWPLAKYITLGLISSGVLDKVRSALCKFSRYSTPF